MRYEVLRGIARINGAQHLKGSFFDADAADVKVQIRKGIVVAAPEKPTAKKLKDADAE
jgi:hypothetical protein